MSPALAGGFFTTEPLGKPNQFLIDVAHFFLFFQENLKMLLPVSIYLSINRILEYSNIELVPLRRG